MNRDDSEIERAWKKLGSDDDTIESADDLEASSSTRTPLPISLQPSQVAMNLKIKDLGEDFKTKRILEKLKLLKQEGEISTTHSHKAEKIHFEAVEDNTAVRACSTCRNSLDLLECSNEENQRKSFARWQNKDNQDITNAIESIVSGKGCGKERIKLHESKTNLNLKINDLDKDPEFKKKKILEQLKKLETERGMLARDENSAQVVQPQDGDIEIRACSTCKNSLDLLTCTKGENQRKSFAMWMAKDESEIRSAYESILGTKSQSFEDRESDTSLVSSGDQSSVENSTSNSPIVSPAEPVMLHQSEISMNLRINNLGADFKHRRVLDQLKLLNSDKTTNRRIDLQVPEEPEEENDENTAVRKCSTCRNSLDLLDCSKADNQRISFQRWQARDSSDIREAIQNLESVNIDTQ